MPPKQTGDFRSSNFTSIASPACEPLVSVIIPVYNAEKYLAEAIASITGQCYRNLEIIIVNDGSTDDSEEIIHRIVDDRIIYLRNPENRGLIYTLNLALSRARGEFIARMDADDIALTNRIKIQTDFLRRNPRYGMCGTYYKTIDEKGRILNVVKLPADSKQTRTCLHFTNCFGHSTIMVRANLIKSLGYRITHPLAEDYDLWFRVSQQMETVNLPVPALHYRVHASNISIKKKEELLQTAMRINKTALEELNISFSEEELSLHTQFLQFQEEAFADSRNFGILKVWLVRLGATMNRSHPDWWDQRTFTEIILRRWFVLCHKTKRYREFLSLSLVRQFKSGYFTGLFRSIWNSMFSIK